MTPQATYRRLPGRSGLIVRDSLWLGADHVLSVRSTLFSETYRRYYFPDIQALVVTEIENILAPIGYTAAALLALTVFALFYIDAMFWAIFASIVTLAVLWMSWEQPSSKCYLLTLISQDVLPSLGRYRSAVKAIALIRAEVEKAQGNVDPAAIQSGLPAAQSAKRAASDFEVRHIAGAVHAAAFALLFVRALLGLAVTNGRMVSVFWSTVGSLLGLTAFVMIILAAIRQHRSDIAPAIRAALWAAFAWFIGCGLGGFILGIYLATQIRVTSPTRVALNSPMLRTYAMVEFVGYGIIGAAGLLTMWQARPMKRPPAAPEPEVGL